MHGKSTKMVDGQIISRFMYGFCGILQSILNTN